MISRCGHFLVVVLVKINCAQIRGLNASAAQGFELTVEGLEPYHVRSTHITTMQPKFCIGSAMHIFSSATTILFKVNSLVGSGVSIKISTFGPRFLFLSAVPTIDALNLHSFKNGNLGSTTHSFANFSTLAKGFLKKRTMNTK